MNKEISFAEFRNCSRKSQKFQNSEKLSFSGNCSKIQKKIWEIDFDEPIPKTWHVDGQGLKSRAIIENSGVILQFLLTRYVVPFRKNWATKND